MKQAAIYYRVSTDDQNPALQVEALHKALRDRNLRLHSEYQDTISAGNKDRPGLARLMQNAACGRFSVVLVWKFDRFARSTQELLTALESFRSYGIDFVSLTEGIDTSTPIGKMVFTFLAAVAEFERSLIRERVKAGMESARARGRKIGRPPCMVDVAEILKMRAQKYSWRAIGKLFCCSPATALKKAKADLVNYP
jgi:DNA invertase Pin-like site-specific DNA recombinase